MYIDRDGNIFILSRTHTYTVACSLRPLALANNTTQIEQTVCI